MLKFLLVLLVFAVATYFLVRVLQQRGAVPRTSPRLKRPQRPQPRRIVAPDDDEDFLRDLERKRRKRPEPEEPDAGS